METWVFGRHESHEGALHHAVVCEERLVQRYWGMERPSPVVADATHVRKDRQAVQTGMTRIGNMFLSLE